MLKSLPSCQDTKTLEIIQNSYLLPNSYLGEEHHVELVGTIVVAGDGRLHKLPVAKINSCYLESSQGFQISELHISMQVVPHHTCLCSGLTQRIPLPRGTNAHLCRLPA